MNNILQLIKDGFALPSSMLIINYKPIFDHPRNLKESSAESENAIKFVEDYICGKSYMVGYEPTTADTKIFDILQKKGIPSANKQGGCNSNHIFRVTKIIAFNTQRNKNMVL